MVLGKSSLKHVLPLSPISASQSGVFTIRIWMRSLSYEPENYTFSCLVHKPVTILLARSTEFGNQRLEHLFEFEEEVRIPHIYSSQQEEGNK